MLSKNSLSANSLADSQLRTAMGHRWALGGEAEGFVSGQRDLADKKRPQYSLFPKQAEATLKLITQR